jgi:hypothetical protein
VSGACFELYAHLLANLPTHLSAHRLFRLPYHVCSGLVDFQRSVLGRADLFQKVQEQLEAGVCFLAACLPLPACLPA